MRRLRLIRSLTRFRSWAAARRLARQFPTVPAAEIAAALVEARRAVESVGVDRDEGHEVVMAIARQDLVRLAQDCGGPADVPAQRRLDPSPERQNRP